MGKNENGRRAYEMREQNGKDGKRVTWASIDKVLGLRPGGSSQAAGRYAALNSLPWPVPGPSGWTAPVLHDSASGKVLYDRRKVSVLSGDGTTWKSLAESVGVPENTVVARARAYAKTAGQPWPITIEAFADDAVEKLRSGDGAAVDYADKVGRVLATPAGSAYPPVPTYPLDGLPRQSRPPEPKRVTLYKVRVGGEFGVYDTTEDAVMHAESGLREGYDAVITSHKAKHPATGADLARVLTDLLNGEV